MKCVLTFKKMSQNDQKPQKMATNWHLLGGRPPQSHSNHLKCTACGKQQWAAQKNPHIAGQGPPWWLKWAKNGFKLASKADLAAS